MPRVDRRVALFGIGASVLGACAGPVEVGGTKKSPRGGIGGTGIVGVVTDFGSIIVNGLRIETNAETEVTDAFGRVDAESLQIGHSLTVEAATVDGALVARRVHISHPVIGQVEQVKGRTAMVAGVPAVLESSGLGTWKRGQWVAVSGLWRGTQVIASRIDPVAKPTVSVIAGVIGQSDLGGALTVGGRSVAFGADLPGIGTFATVGGALDGDRFDPQWITPGRFFGSAGPLNDLSIEGYLEPAAKAPFFTLSGLGHSFDRDAKLAALTDKRVLFTGPYIGTFAVAEGLPLPEDQDARRGLVRRIVDGDQVSGRVQAR
ncbi:MAG: DUF5666 domain-containing protein [Pseudomonadota bacterium]